MVQKRSKYLHTLFSRMVKKQLAPKRRCNGQTFLNTSRNFGLKHFCIRCDARKIALHMIQQHIDISAMCWLVILLFYDFCCF